MRPRPDGQLVKAKLAGKWVFHDTSWKPSKTRSYHRLQMCKHSSIGCPAPFQPAPTPTRTQKWTPIIFPSTFPAGPDAPRAEPGAAPADTAPALDAADSPEQTPPAPLQPHPRGSWQGDAAPPAPHQPMADGQQTREHRGWHQRQNQHDVGWSRR